MRCRATARRASFLVLSAAACVALGGFAQPERDDPDRHEGEPARAVQPEQLRERIEARLAWARGFVERLEQGLERLDRGESLEPALMRELGRTMMDGPRGRGDEPRRGEEPDRPDRSGDDRPTLAEMKAFIDEHVPWLAERLAQMDERSPGSVDRMLEGMAPRIADIMRRNREDPEAAALYIEQFRLGADIVDASRRIRRAVAAGEMTEAQALAAWRELAARHLDIRERLTRHEAEQTRTRLAELEAQLARDAERREETITDMAERMHRRSARFDRDRGPGDRPRDGDKSEDDRRGGDGRP